MEKELEIEKKLNVTIHMPQICSYCDEEITEKYGLDGECLIIHSIDGNHDNWTMHNKTPMHKRCHMSHHMLIDNSRGVRRKIKKIKRDLSLFKTDEEQVLYVIRRLKDKGLEVTKTKLMQQTGWRKDKTRTILNKLLMEDKIRMVFGYSNRSYVHYEEVTE